MEDYVRKEKLKIEVLDQIKEKEHFHQDVELLYLLNGEMNIGIDDTVVHMEKDDLFVVNANKRHNLQCSEDILYAKLLISYELVSDIFNSVDIIFWCDSTKEENEHFEELRQIMKQLLNHYFGAKGGTDNFGHISLCYRAMELLSIHFLVQTADKEKVTDKDKFNNRIMQINNYIRANYNQQISLNDLSNQLFLSNAYLSRFFKKNYGMSFGQYLTNIRLYHAVDELLYSSIPITRIAIENGFASVAAFNMSFKKAYNETPSSFRKKNSMQKMKDEELPKDTTVTLKLGKYLRQENTYEPECQNALTKSIQCDVSSSNQIKKVWKKLINAGSAEDLMRFEVREHLLLLKRELKFEYVRFWNIISKEMLIDVNVDVEDLNFSRIDSLLDFFTMNQIKPFIELCWKPSRIQRNVQQSIVYKNNYQSFQTAQQCQEIMNSLISHIVQRYGQEEVRSWMFSAWEDSPYDQEAEEISSRQNYYNVLYDVIKKNIWDAKVGGGGFQLDLASQRTQKSITKWSYGERVPDFVTLKYYAYEREEFEQEVYSKRTTDYNDMIHKILNFKELLKESKMENIPLWISEWNMTISDRNFLNDACFKSAYIIKNTVDVYTYCQGMGYYTATDLTSEHYDTHQLLYGGMGLLSKDGIMKPAAYAFEFLNKLYENEIAKGNHYLITTNKRNSYSIVCHNQKRLNYNYYYYNEDKVDKENIWKYYEDNESLELNFELLNIEDGTYKIRLYRINSENGSILSYWEKMNYEKNLTQEDVQYLRKVCEPELIIWKKSTRKEKLEFQLELKPNEIQYISIKKVH